MKTKLKHFLNVPTNKDKQSLGRVPVQYMIWSPVYHWWIYPDNSQWEMFSKREKKFLLNQEVVLIGLRNDTPNRVALFLKDYGKEKNKKLKEKLKR